MLPGHWRATGATQPAAAANIAGAGGDAVPVDDFDDYCALPTRITGEIEDGVDLE